MAGAFKYMNGLRSLIKGGTILSAAAVTAMSVTPGGNKSKTVNTGKDKVVFISKEENSVPPTLQLYIQDLSENRDRLLPNGDINLACQCIEKDVVGPCNHEFLKLQALLHERGIIDLESMPLEEMDELDGLFEDYVHCNLDHPVYYADSMLDVEIEDMEQKKKKQETLLQEQQKVREANTRNFGKDTVVFLTKEEAKSPCLAKVPACVVEEDRGPLNPDGSVNWGCTCIERDVVGPCNLEFRKFREFAASLRNQEVEKFSEEQISIFSNFLACIKHHPDYYASILEGVSKSDTDSDIESSINPEDMEG